MLLGHVFKQRIPSATVKRFCAIMCGVVLQGMRMMNLTAWEAAYGGKTPRNGTVHATYAHH